MKHIAMILIFLINPVWGAEKQIDYVNLGAKLLKDGYTQRAKEVLEKVDVTGADFDFARFYTLKGILLQKLAYPMLSNIFFDSAIARGQASPTIQLYIARNHWQLHNYANVVAALDKAGEVAKNNEQMMVIKADAFKQQGLIQQAWKVLDEGIARFPASANFYRQKFYYLAELGYYQQAMVYANKLLEANKYSAKDYLSLGYILRENKQYRKAAVLLEEAVISYSSNKKLLELLGQVYIDQQHYLMAALVYDWASLSYPEYAHKAAALYLKAKQPVRALQLNRRVLAQKEKFKQRLSIDIYLDDYESMVSTVPALKRYDLLKEDNIKYAIGYGYYMNGDFANAKKYLKQVTDGRLFAKASHIFQQIEKCQDDPFECN
jgi:tetratricopeptide (TPR) repeat protein